MSESMPRPSFVQDVFQKGPASFFNLPRELKLYIFSFVPRIELCETVARVCQHWWKLSTEPSLWKSLNISVKFPDETRNLSLLLLRSPMLTKLKISSYYSLEDFALFAFACPMLKHLDLSCCEHVNHQIVALFVKNCPLIEKLNLMFCEKLEKTAVSSIVNLTQLRMLSVDGCYSMDDNCIQLISEKCKHLEDFGFRIGINVTEKSICNVVKNLHASLLRLELSGRDMTDLTLSKVSLCTRLQHFGLFPKDCKDLTDQSLVYLKKLTRLRSLTLCYGRFNTAVAHSTIAINNYFTGSHVRNLEKLELWDSRINDDGIYNITQNCKQLKKFRLLSCYEVTEVGLDHIVKHCKNLTHLELHYMNFSGLCLKSIPEKLSSLEFLDLEDCGGIENSVRVYLELQVRKLRVKWPNYNDDSDNGDDDDDDDNDEDD